MIVGVVFGASAQGMEDSPRSTGTFRDRVGRMPRDLQDNLRGVIKEGKGFDALHDFDIELLWEYFISGNKQAYALWDRLVANCLDRELSVAEIKILEKNLENSERPQKWSSAEQAIYEKFMRLRYDERSPFYRIEK